MKTRTMWAGLFSAGVSLIALAPVSAMAQAPASAPTAGKVEEIVVTARRREETLQQVPIAVTAIRGDDLEAQGAQDLTSISQNIPNITLENSRATNSTLTAFIRGVGQQDPVAGFEQGVGIYLDDVYLNRPQGAVLDVYDVERIEVLRGPQGTLYGRNTVGGAVKYVTKRLDKDNPTLRARASYGSYNQFDAVVSGSVPVNDMFRVGAAFALLTRDGFGKNLTTGEENYDKDVKAYRASAELEPSSNLLIRLAVDHTEDDSAPRQGYRLFPSLVPGAQPALLSNKYDTLAGAGRLGPVFKNTVEATGGQALIDWSVSNSLTIKSITAYREDKTKSPIDFDSTAARSFDAPVEYKNRQFSQELQATYTSENFNLVAGGYYLDANAFNAFDVVFGTVTSFTLGDVDTKTWALFGEGTYNFTPEWAMTLGARYTSDKRTSKIVRQTFLGVNSPYFGNRAAVSITPPVLVNGRQVVPEFNGSRTDDAFNPRVILSYQPNRDLNLYASYSQGFKGGGFDPRGNFANADVRQGFLPEQVNSYEAGVKTTLLDGRATLNTALFYADYKDVQIPGSLIIPGPPVSFVGTVTNAGKAVIKGLEVESSVSFTDQLSGQFSLGLVNAKYTKFLLNGVDVSGQRDVQNTPDVTGSASLTHTWPVSFGGMDGTLGLTGSAAYRSKTQQFETAIPLLDQPSYWLVDAAINWTSEGGRWRFGIAGRNLTDERYISSGYNFPGAATDNSVLAFYGNPRTVTGTIELRF